MLVKSTQHNKNTLQSSNNANYHYSPANKIRQTNASKIRQTNAGKIRQTKRGSKPISEPFIYHYTADSEDNVQSNLFWITITLAIKEMWNPSIFNLSSNRFYNKIKFITQFYTCHIPEQNLWTITINKQPRWKPKITLTHAIP